MKQLGYRTFIFNFVLALFFALNSKASEVVNGGSSEFVYEATIEKTLAGAETFKANFEIKKPLEAHFLSIAAADDSMKSVIAIVNGKRVAEMDRPDFRANSLVKINTSKSNSIELKINGSRTGIVTVKVLQLKNFYPLSDELKSVKLKSRIEFASDETNARHLLLIDGSKDALLKLKTSQIRLNGKSILAADDLKLGEENRIYKPVLLSKKNILDFVQIGKEALDLKISVLRQVSIDEFSSPGELAFVGVDPFKFNQIGSDVVVEVKRTKLPSKNPSVTILVNDNTLEDSQFSISPNRIVIPKILKTEETKLRIITFDVKNGELGVEETIWAGSAKIEVHVTRNKVPVGDAEVTLALDEDDKAGFRGTTDKMGRLVIPNLPQRKARILVKHQNNRIYLEKPITDQAKFEVALP